jgi:choline-sulfatase
MTDQQRYDHVGWAASPKIRTPNMDRIAQGAAFTRCQSVNPICQPARTALLTGKYCRQIGTLSMAGDLDRRHPTYPQALRDAGYWTAGIGKFHFLQSWPWSTPRGEGNDLTELAPQMHELGFDLVWQTAGKQLAIKDYCDYCAYMESHGLLEAYRDEMEARGGNRAYPDGELEKDGEEWPFAEEHHVDIVTGRKIREAIDQRPKDRPFFIFGSFCSPHKPMDPPRRFLDGVPYEEEDDFIQGKQPLGGRDKKNLWKLRRAYKAMIQLVDEEIGRILDQLIREGLLEDTMIVLTSDHGEMMGDHGLVQKSEFWRESQQVPLAIRHPGCPGGIVCNSPVELTDITATLLDVAGIDPASALSKKWPAHNHEVPCRSLLPILKGETGTVRDFAFSECKNLWSSIVSDRHKYVRFHNGEHPDRIEELLFDTDQDPEELRDLAGMSDSAETLEWHRRRLAYVRDRMPPAQHVWAK